MTERWESETVLEPVRPTKPVFPGRNSRSPLRADLTASTPDPVPEVGRGLNAAVGRGVEAISGTSAEPEDAA